MQKIFTQLFCLFFLPLAVLGQTSWTGTTSTNWSTASNWTSGVPTGTVDAIIGDASFTGSFHPSLTANSICKSLTIGNGVPTPTLSVTKNLTVNGSVTIGANGTIIHNTAATTITTKGNWSNSGTYSGGSATAMVTFSGTAQAISGSASFRQVTINAGSVVTLGINMSVQNSLAVSGTLDPTASYAVNGAGSLTVNSGGVIHVRTADFATNYPISGAVSLNGRSTVNYSSSAVDQNVTNVLTYGYLRLSGGMTKTLTGNLPALNSSSNNAGRIYIDAGTLELGSYTANRGTSVNGGSISISNGATLRIGGTGGFPSNYNSVTMASNSTVVFYGANQTISAYTYGNLGFSSSSGSVVKTMPGTALTVAGSFSCTAGSGTGVTFTAGNNITVNRDVTIGSGCTFNASSYSHSFRGNWTNNGTVTGGTSTCTFRGASSSWSGAGANGFNNLAFTGSGITAASTVSLTISGNLSTSGAGTFNHSAPGLLSMSGASKSIGGNGISLGDLSVSGSISSSQNFTVKGHLTVDGTYTATNGILTMSGISKTISGSGTLTFRGLTIQGTVSTGNNFTIKGNLSVAAAGSFTASAGVATVDGNIVLSGTANLFDIVVNAGRTLRLGSNSVLGIAGAFTKTGTLNVTTSAPNTVNYNGAGAQSIVNTTYSNLIVSNGGTKTAAGAITINNDLTIATGVTLAASSFTHSIYRHFTNNGSFTASTSTWQMLGGQVAYITGATTFNNLTVNKSSAAISVNLSSSIQTTNLTMTAGNMQTGSNSVTITGNRTGNGIIIGIINRNHSFNNGTTYYFEGPNNSVTFSGPSGVTAVTMTVTLGFVNDFNTGSESVNREYNISIPAGTFTNATWRMHYEDNELNAFDEPNLTMYRYNSGTSVWDSIGYSSRSTASNYVELTGATVLASRWTLSGIRNIVSWNGSVSTAWENASNWTTISGSDMSNRVPGSNDEAQVGTGTFTNSPLISTARSVNSLRFGSAQAGHLTINGGSLSIVGNLRGEWTTNATHTITVGSYSLTVGNNYYMSDGTSGHDIDLTISTGTLSVTNEMVQTGNASIQFTSNGLLLLNGVHTYSSGSFTAGPGTVQYSGSEAQTIAPVTYNHLIVAKSTEKARINNPVIVNGNLTTTTGGELEINDTVSVAGDLTIGNGNTVNETGARINVAGNFTNSGTFNVSTGSVQFYGSSNQSVNANTFNVLIVNKSSGSLTLGGDLTINSDLTLTAGTMDLGTYLSDRSNPGGNLVLGSAALLKIGGAANFPNNFNTQTLDASSTVEYNGTVAQTVNMVDYGNLTLSNGGSNTKSLTGNVQLNGNFLINSGATFDPDSNNISLYGNFTNNGTYSPSGSTLILNGSSKSLSGSSATTLYNLSVIGGSYTASGGAISMSGDLFIGSASSMNFGSITVTLDGDLTNMGSLTSSGTANFTGSRVQTMQLINAITSASTGIVNFNGTVAPVFGGNGSPQFATVNINNTGGITAISPWTVFVAFNIASGCTFNGGPLMHTIYGNFSNNGVVTSDGDLYFRPGAPFSAGATLLLDAAGGSFTSTGKVEFGGTGAITVSTLAPVFNDIDILNTNASGINPPSGWTIGGNFLVGPGATFNAGSGLSHSIAGSTTNNGTLNGNTSTVTYLGSPSYIHGLGTGNYYHLIVDASATLILNKSLYVSGDFTVNGAFTGTGRKMTFNGSTNSIISGAAGSVAFGDFEMDKSGGATTQLNVPITIAEDLNLFNGNLITTSVNLLTLLDGATSTAGNAGSYVVGPMKKIGDDAFVFPIGKGTYWACLGITAPTSATAAFQAEYFNTAYTNTTSITAPLDHVSKVEYWTLDRTASTDNVSVSLFWEDGSHSGINDMLDITVAHFSGGSWVDETQNGGTTGSASAGSVTSQAVSSFSPFTFGSKNPAVNPLPVEFIEFAVNPIEEGALLQWKTAHESNSERHEIERSIDGLSWTEIGSVKAAGFSSVESNYVWNDNDMTIRQRAAEYYYRIRQVDQDGQWTLSPVRILAGSGVGGLTMFPNPATERVMVRLPEDYKSNVLLIIQDIFGREYYSKEWVGDSGLIILTDLSMPPGIYSVIASGPGMYEKRKLIIK